MTRSLMFTTAVNGFASRYRTCIESQRAYADRIGCEFVCVDRPRRMADPALASWLKITLLNRWLRSGFDYAAFLDADCEVRPHAPDWRELFDGRESVLMALGRSGRVNSGVIYAKADRNARRFFGKVERSVAWKRPFYYRRNLRYENGNVLYVADRTGWVGSLGPEWNNTVGPHVDDYVRHYTGPLRALYNPSFWDTLPSRFYGLSVPLSPKHAPRRRGEEFIQELTSLTDQTVQRYTPELWVPAEIDAS